LLLPHFLNKKKRFDFPSDNRFIMIYIFPNKRLYAERYEVFQALYPALKDVYPKI